MRVAKVLISAVLGGVLAAVPAVAQPLAPVEIGLFSFFKRICATDLAPAKVAAEARRLGFADSDKPAGKGFDDVKVFESGAGGKSFTLFTGRATGKPRDGMPASKTMACGISVKGDDKGAKARAAAWAAVPVDKKVPGVVLHPFRTAASGHAALALDDKPAIRAALLAGDLNVLTILTLNGSTTLLLTRTRAG